MNINMYRRVEGMLYSHYRKKKKIYILRVRLARTEERIYKLRKDIRECNVELEDTLQAIDYSKDRVQTSSTISNIEKSLEIAIDKLIKELGINIRQKYKLKNKIMNLEKQIENIDMLLEKLTDEELEIVELKYAEEMNYREMEQKLFMARSTIQRKKDRIIKFLIEEIK